MSSYISLYNETNGDFNNLVVDDLTVTNLTVDNVDVKNAVIDDEKVNTSLIQDLSIGNRLLLPDGKISSPSLAFTSETDLGLYKSNTNEISLVNNSLPILKVSDSATNLYSNLITDNQIILNDLSASSLNPSLNFFDIGLGVFRSNPDVLSIASEGFKIVDIDSLKLKVNGAIEANSAIITGPVTISTLTAGNLSVTGTSSFSGSMTSSDIKSGNINTGTNSVISSNFAVTSTSNTDIITLYTSPTNPSTPSPGFTFGNRYFTSKILIISRVKYNYALYGGGNNVGVWNSSGTLLYSRVFDGTEAISGSFRYVDVAIRVGSPYFSIGAVTSAPNYVLPAGGFPGCTINGSYITGCDFYYNVGGTLGYPNTFVIANNTAGVLVGVEVTASPILNSNGLYMTSSALNCAAITSTSITNSGTMSSVGILNTGTLSSTSSATIGALTTTSISNTGTLSSTSSATIGALTTTSINCSGTLSAGTTIISGTLQTTSAARISVGSPNTNSTNALDIYGLLGCSLANHNTYYGINAYYSGGWRPIRNGYSASWGLGASGGISMYQSATSNTADSIITYNPMLYIATTGDTQIYGNFNAPSCYLTAQPMLVRQSGGVAQTIPNNSAQTLTIFGTVVINQGATITYSSGIFTVPLSGTYYIECILRWTGNSTGIREIYLINVTTNITFGGGTINCSGNSRRVLVHANGVVKCSAGDQFAATVYQNSGGNLDVQDTGSDRVQFTVLRLH